ncbi:MAG: hypothetical protein U5K76_13650 [Woeseiaceae bacterium]|nr:hypothetical protein [Woeseiaceae bacterium]
MAIEHLRHRRGGAGRVRLFGAAEGRRGVEIELAVLQVRHLRQAAAQRVQANDAGVHLADAQGERIERVFGLPTRGGNRGPLCVEFRVQGFGGFQGDAGSGVDRVNVAAEKCRAAKDGDCQRGNERRGHAGQVDLPGLAEPLAENNYIHALRPGCVNLILRVRIGPLHRSPGCRGRRPLIVIGLQWMVTSAAPLS